MKILIVIIFILFAVFVGSMIYALCYFAGEADDADQEIWERYMKEQEEQS